MQLAATNQLPAYYLTVLKPICVKLLIVGINRSLSYTHRSIQKHLRDPLERRSDVVLQTSLALIHQADGVSNPWSGEFGSLEHHVPEMFKPEEIRYLDGAALRASVKDLAQRLTNIEDTWGDQGKSIENALVFLRALSTMAPTEDDAADIIVFARPDVLIRRRLSIARVVGAARRLRESGNATTFLPAWGTNSGLNDVFAVVPKEHVNFYFHRFDKVPALLDAGTRFHSESFLKHVYREIPHQSSIHTPMVRVRIGGSIPALDLRFEREHRLHNRLLREARKKWRAHRSRVVANGG